VENFSTTFSLAVEVKHKSWQAPETLDFLQDFGVAVCNLGYPTTWNSFTLQQCTVGEHGYFRMHGRKKKTGSVKPAETRRMITITTTRAFANKKEEFCKIEVRHILFQKIGSTIF
jgi:uncharacterized protein YecE (DUF72 family)